MMNRIYWLTANFFPVTVILLSAVGFTTVANGQLTIDPQRSPQLIPANIQEAKSLVTEDAPSISAAQPAAVAGAVAETEDVYFLKGGKRVTLLRLENEMVIRKPQAAAAENIEESLQSLKQIIPNTELQSTETISSVQTRRTELLKSTREFTDNDRRSLAESAKVAFAYPVFVDRDSGKRMVPTDEILIRLQAGENFDDISAAVTAAGLRLESSSSAAHRNSHLLKAIDASTFDPFVAARELSDRPEVLWAEPNFLREIEKSFTPNDPLYTKQQSHHNSGQNGGLSDADVDAPEAWNTTRGDNSIVVAVLDDGVDTSHPDLRIYSNPGETGGGKETNGVDDDGNGRIDDVEGWDFGLGGIGDNNANPAGTNGHGTGVAGVTAAIHNTANVAGIAGDCTILPIKITDDGGTFASSFAIGEAISYAAEHADILNNSWGGGSPSSFINDAITDAATNGRGGKGCPVFFASGNSASTWYRGGGRQRLPTTGATGSVRFAFYYEKGASSGGENAVRVDNVCLLDSDGFTHLNSEDFEGSFSWLVSNGGGATSNWFLSTTNSLKGTGGTASFRSPSLTSGQFAFLISPPMTVTGAESLAFALSASMPTDSKFQFLIYTEDLTTFITGYDLTANVAGIPFVAGTVSYPASEPNAIAVGSATDRARRSDYSQYGSTLDFVAPSNGGWNDIATLDPLGAVGWNPTDVKMNFGGTSSASPLAAGVGALMLSQHPGLSAAQVRQMMRDTAVQIGPLTYPGGRNDEYGDGMVNANAAVLAADAARATVEFTSATYQKDEDGTSATISVERTGSTIGEVTVNYATSAGTASAGSDFTNSSGTLTWSDGDGSDKTFTVAIVDESTVELNETVNLSLSDPSGADLGTTATGTLTITNEDSASINITGTSQSESTEALEFNITLSAPVDIPVTVEFDTISGGTASGGGTDFDNIANQVVTFSAGSTSPQTVSITVNNDGLVEPNETVVGEINALSAGGRAVILLGGGSSKSATGTIQNDDSPPVVSIPDLTEASDTGISAVDNLTKNNQPTLSGTSTPGATILLHSSIGGQVGSGLANGSGVWSFSTSGTLPDGQHLVTATAVDGFGNSSGASGSLSVTIDTSGPAAGTPDLIGASDSGSSNSDNLTKDTTPAFSGTAEAGAAISLRANGSQVGTGTATGGNWGITSSALAEGARSITIVATDAAGNTTTSAALPVTIDTTAPAAGTPDLTDASDSGSADDDDLTKITTPAFTGTAEANAAVSLRSDGSQVGTGTATGGNWSITSSTLAEGARSITIVATDMAGNTTTSTGLSITIDTSAPAAPTGLDLAAGSDTGTSNSDEITSDDTPTIGGDSENGSLVTLVSSINNQVGTGSANSPFSITASTLNEGVHAITAFATDAAGNQGASSTALSVTIDTTAPAKPTGLDLVAASDSGSSNSDDITNIDTPTISGTAGAGTSVTLESSIDNVIGGDSGGSFSIVTSELSEGTHSITAFASDLAGNEGLSSTALSVTIDTMAPAAGAPDLTDASDSGTADDDDLTKITTPAFIGTAEANAAVSLRSSGSQVGTGTASGGNWSITSSSLAEGARSITIVATDTAGNTATSPALSVTIDATAPVAPTGLDLAAASDTGSSNSDEITKDITPTISGDAENGSVVTLVSSLNNQVGTGNANSAFSVTASFLSNGVHSMTAFATDAAGNSGPSSSALSITVDTSVPAAGTPDLVAGSDSGVSDSDNITNDDTPSFSGTAEAGTAISLRSNGSEVGSGSASGGNWNITASALADGSHGVTIIATDTAGNSTTSAILSVTIDTSAPAAPTGLDLAAGSDSGSSNSDEITNDDTPTIGGDAENGSLVTLVSSIDNQVGTGSANSPFSITASTLSEGVHSMTAFATDAAGNQGPSSTGLSVTIDTTDPVAGVPDLTNASDSGTADDDDLTSDTTPSFTGTAETNAAISLRSDGSQVGAGTATGGNWSITASALAEGTRSITIVATDAAGNTATSTGLSITIDDTAPAAPTGLDLAAGSDSGTSNSDEITSDDTPTIGGDAESGSLVTLVSSINNQVGTGSANSPFSITASSLDDGVHAITAFATDAAGNQGPSSTGLSVTIDTTAPAAGVPDLTDASDSGSADDDDLTNDTTPSFTGTAEANAAISLRSNGSQVGTGTATGGNWSITSSTLAEGARSITIVATDTAGNTATSASLPVTIDTSAPAAPSAPDLISLSDSGTSNTDNLTNDDTPSFEGTAESGSTVTLFRDGNPHETGSSDGDWSVTSGALADSGYVFAARATDVAGNNSPLGATLSVTIDTTAPAIPSTPDLESGSDSGSSQTDNITKDDTPTLSGTSDASVTVALLRNGNPAGSVSSTGTWSLTTAALADAIHQFTATATDNAGNTSAASGSLAVTVDTAAPAAPGAPDLSASSDTGSSDSDDITMDNTPTFEGSAESGSSVELQADGNPVGTDVSDGSWSITTSVLSDGNISFRVAVTDAAGNISPVSTALLVAFDTSAPAAPSAPNLTSSSDSGVSDTDNITKDDTPGFEGTAESGSTVTLYRNGNPHETGLSDGSWTITSGSLTDNSFIFAARSTDLAGNISSLGTTLAVTIDTVAPAIPSTPDLESGSDSGSSQTDNLTNDDTPTLSGTSVASVTVELLRNGNPAGSVSSTGTWSVTTASLSDAVHQFSARATDVAGNSSAPSSELGVTVDTGAPAAPSIPDLDSGSDTGRFDDDEITNDNTPTFTGTSLASVTVNLLRNGNPAGSVASSGSWSVTTASLSDAAHSFTATATDGAGNISPASDALSVTVDTASPAAPSLPDLTAATDSGTSNTDNITKDNTPDFSGTAESDSRVMLLVSGAGNNVVNTTGNWTITAAEIADGSHTITAQATDLAGNASVASDGLPVTIDTVAPAVPSTPDLTSGRDSGISNSDNITNEAPQFVGTADTGSTLTLFRGVTVLATQLVSSGNWAIQLGTQADGVYPFTATSTDVAGNSSGATSELEIEIDATSPGFTLEKAGAQADPATSGPVLFDLVASEPVHGLASSDVTAGGTAAGTVSLSGGPTDHLVTIAASNSEGTITAALAADKATDTAGNPNTAAVSGDNSVSLDVHEGEDGDATEIDVTSGSGSQSGWLEPGDVDAFTITLTTAKQVSVVTSGDLDTYGELTDSSDSLVHDPNADHDSGPGKNLLIEKTLGAGIYRIELRAIGVENTGNYGITITLTDPPILINEVDSLSQTLGGEDMEFIELFDGGVGNLALDDFVVVLFSGDDETSYLAIDLDGETTDANGYFVIGNPGVAEADLVVPAAFLNDGHDAVAVYEASAADFPNDTPFTESNLLDALAYLDEGQSEDGNLPTILLPDELRVKESANGYASGHSLQRMPDGEGGPRVTSGYAAVAPTPGASNQLPGAPGTPDLDEASDSGSSQVDDLTNVVLPVINGSASFGSKVRLTSDRDGVFGTAFALADGSYSLNVPDFALSEGIHLITPTTISSNLDGATLSIEIDTTAPAAPSVLDLDSGSDSGVSDSDDVTMETNPVISGEADAGSLVTLYDGSTELGTGMANSPWSITSSTLSEGIKGLTATAMDPAGNESIHSDGLGVTIDTTKPAVTVEISGGQSDPATAGPVDFIADFSEDVFGFASGDLSVTGNAAGSVSVSGGPRTYGITVQSTTNEGVILASVVADSVTDRAGNMNLASTSNDNRVSLDVHGDTPGTATVVVVSSGTGSQSGFLDPGDADMFTFTLPEPRIAIVFTTGVVDTIGSLRNETGNLLNDPDDDDDEGDGNNFRIAEPLPAGTYTVLVASNGGEGEYGIHFDVLGLPMIQPDLTIRGLGNDVYGVTGGQTVSLTSKKARPVSVVSSVQNDGVISDSFRLSARRGTSLFRVSYLSLTQGNVTAGIITGLHETVLTAPDEIAENIRVLVRPNKRKIRKKIRQKGKTKFKYKKKRLAIIMQATSEAGGTTDRGLINVRTK